MTIRYLVHDYETKSEAPLKKCGTFEYSMHHSTRHLCVGWRYGTREELRKELDQKVPVRLWSQYIDRKVPTELVHAFQSPDTIFVAHNALFEQMITRNVLSKLLPNLKELKNLPPERWICTASLAAALALPRKLEGACSALGLPVQKDMEGHKLMMKMCKPKKPTKKDPGIWHNKVSDLLRLMQYCGTDVDAETELFLRARPLSPFERRVWELDQRINLRGFAIDRELIEKTLMLIDQEKNNLDKETDEMTWGGISSATQRDAILRWLEAEDLHLPDLRAKTVADLIATGEVGGDALRLLQIRQAISKTSTAKYMAFKMRSETDHVIRDNLVYHGASTGRWSGAGVQPQNFPRGAIKDVPLAIEAIKTGDLEYVRMLYGNPMNVFASCLRGAIVARPGKVLYCADYAAIEARMGFWFAKHSMGLKAFFEDKKIYEEMASKIFGRPADEISAGYKADDPESTRQRFVGKQVVLGCSYNMGWKKFQQSCLNLGVPVEDDLAKTAVTVYRTVHSPVKQFWYNIERASIAAAKNPGRRYTLNHVSWFVQGDFLWCELPSGRRLAYYKPVVKENTLPWGEKKLGLFHWSINPRTRKWELASTYGGKLCENIVQAASRDLMAAAMLRIEAAGYNILLSVHDELLAERDEGTGSVEEFERLMSELPAWAAGAPVKASGWTGKIYRK